MTLWLGSQQWQHVIDKDLACSGVILIADIDFLVHRHPVLCSLWLICPLEGPELSALYEDLLC